MRIAILYNKPVLPVEHPDYASEAGVLEAVEAFAAALNKLPSNVVRIGIRDSIPDLIARLSAAPPDVIVNFCEGFAGHSRGEAQVTSLLDLLRLPYTGSSAECMALVRDKLRTKQILTAAGIPTARYWRVRRDEQLESSPLADELRGELKRAPLFAKPAAEDASLGIDDRSVARKWEPLVGKVRDLQQRYGDVLVERYLDGREFNVGVLALPEPRLLPIAEIEFQTNPDFPWPVVTYDSKWRAGSSACRGTSVRCPAAVDQATAARIEQTALAAFEATGCRDYARVDLRLTSAGKLFVLEVNANPDAGPSAGLARAIGVAGMSYDEFAARLVENAARRTKASQTSLSLRERAGERESTNVALENRPADAEITIRGIRAADRTALVDVLRACAMFRPDEIEVADEILEEAVRDGASCHYHVLVAESAGAPVGWSCHGRVPLTDATYDLYWIAVHPDVQGRRIGRALLAAIEQSLHQADARWLVAETSSSASYDNTRRFYEKTGFTLVGNVPDFYREDDGRITYAKRLD